jgi:hypothetical protein
MANNEDDWAFFLGEEVVVGTQTGKVMGCRTHSFKPDSFDIQIINDAGLPEEREFFGYAIVKTRKN